MNKPWTHEELRAMLPAARANLEKLEAEITEQDGADVKAVPPSTKEECMDYLWRLMDIAVERPLQRKEITLFGQLLAQFEQSILAERLGKKGRYYCIPEDKIMEMVNAGH